MLISWWFLSNWIPFRVHIHLLFEIFPKWSNHFIGSTKSVTFKNIICSTLTKSNFTNEIKIPTKFIGFSWIRATPKSWIYIERYLNRKYFNTIIIIYIYTYISSKFSKNLMFYYLIISVYNTQCYNKYNFQYIFNINH